jgi:hypothetical protein
VQRLLHLNRGLPGSTVYDLSTVQRPEIRGEISPRIKCSSLRFKCNSLLYLNRGLPGSAVYDLSTVRQPGPRTGRKGGLRCCGRVIHNLARESKCPPQRRGDGRSDLVQAAVPGQLNAGDVAAVVRGDLQALRKSCAGGIASCTYSLEKPGTE